MLAPTLGIVTPFRSCSAVPRFIGFLAASVPLRFTFAFLISAPMVNEIALVRLFGVFGWQVASLDVGLGLLVAILTGLLIGGLRMEALLEDWVPAMLARPAGPANGVPLSWLQRLHAGGARVREIVGKVWPYVLAGSDRAVCTGDDHPAQGAQSEADHHLFRCRGKRHPARALRLQRDALTRMPTCQRFRFLTRCRRWQLICLLALAALASQVAAAASPTWIDSDAAGERRVHLYFFWTSSCPHCQAARPFVEALPTHHPWLLLHSRNLSTDRDAVADYIAFAESLGQEASSVPAFLFCGRMEVGFERPETTGRALEEALQSCREEGGEPAGAAAAASAPTRAIDVPLLGRMAPDQLSLPVFTILIAGLDAFNPCAFFVLLFLLSLLIHAGSRARMLFIGSVFLFFSGLIYFLFMAAWLNVFRWLGEISLVTTAAGVLAIVIALLNIKDYFWFRKGVSLSIPENAKPGLYRRMRELLRAESMPALTLGTVALAMAANAYELLCTAGFPMVYTRLLTLSDLPPWQHYAYLAFYNLVYVIPLLLITLVFTCTLGSRKLSAAEGRLLKLLSGVMMLGLGGLLVVAPAALNDLRVALALLGGAISVSWLVHRLLPPGGDAAG